MTSRTASVRIFQFTTFSPPIPPFLKLNSALSWGNDLDSGEIASIPGGIAREQGKPADGCVRSDVETRQRRVP
jgi:hypothetical protein